MSNEAAVGANMLLGKGELYIDRFDTSGLSTGERFAGNVEALEITTTDEIKQKFSSVQHNAPLAAQALARRTVELAITMDEYNRQNVALALMGAEGTYTQLGTAITAEPSKVPTLGTWVKLANRKIAAVAVHKGATLYSGVTDYVVDAETGRIKPLATGTMVAGDAITVDYTRTAITAADKVSGGSSTLIDAALRFVPDPAAGPAWDLEVWHVQLTPDGAFTGLIGDDYGTYKLKATVIDDSANHPNDPLYRAIRRA